MPQPKRISIVIAAIMMISCGVDKGASPAPPAVDATPPAAQIDSAERPTEPGARSVVESAPLHRQQIHRSERDSPVAHSSEDPIRIQDALVADIQSNPGISLRMHELSLLHAEESRDEVWAAGVESRMRVALSDRIARHGKGLDVGAVLCKKTVCEMRAINDAGKAQSSVGWQAVIADIRDGKAPETNFSDIYTTMKPLPDGRVVYVTYAMK